MDEEHKHRTAFITAEGLSSSIGYPKALQVDPAASRKTSKNCVEK